MFHVYSGRYMRITCVLSVILCVFLLSSCSGDHLSISNDNPYAEDFVENYNEAKTTLVKKILEDGVITEVEMNEFADVFQQCMAENGLDWTWNENEGESIDFGMEANIDVELVNDIQMHCYNETDYLNIMPLYDRISVNPDKLNADEFNTKVLDCMKSYDLIDKDMDPTYFLSFYTGVGSSEKPEYKKYLTPLEDERDPNFDLDKSERYWACVTDPLALNVN